MIFPAALACERWRLLPSGWPAATSISMRACFPARARASRNISASARISSSVKIALFYHSLVSDWNHGNAHFLRGIVSELKTRGHEVLVYEPVGGWSFTNLIREAGGTAIADFHSAYPGLES